MHKISNEEKSYLRELAKKHMELAKKHMELANLTIMQERKEL